MSEHMRHSDENGNFAGWSEANSSGDLTHRDAQGNTIGWSSHSGPRRVTPGKFDPRPFYGSPTEKVRTWGGFAAAFVFVSALVGTGLIHWLDGSSDVMDIWPMGLVGMPIIEGSAVGFATTLPKRSNWSWSGWAPTLLARLAVLIASTGLTYLYLEGQGAL